MKILYLHQHFRKPEQWGSTRSWYLAGALAKAGHEVHLIAAHNEKTQKTESINGFTVHFLPVPYRQEFGMLKRGLSFLKFSRQAYFKSVSLLNPNEKTLTYASSTPLSVGIVALLLKRFYKLQYIFEVRDLWPEAPVEMGIIRNGLLKSLLFRITKKIYKNARGIISLSPGITAGIEKYAVKSPVYELPNFSDTALFKPIEENETLRKRYLREDEKGVIYFGALGKANHLEYLLAIAAEAQKMQLPLRFFIAGDGSEKPRLEKLAKEMNAGNLHFLPAIPKNELPAIVGIMDFSYISFLDIPVLTSCSPNKLFDSLAAGKFCITNTKGWIRQMLEKENCGFYANPLRPVDFIEKISPYLSDTVLLKTFQSNARQAALQNYSSVIIGSKLVGLINSLEKT